MKANLILSAFFAFLFCITSAQVPQGFNYQAIARDGSGNPITNATISVKLSILTDTTGFFASGSGNYLWEEEQINIKTNAFGLFTVVFGNPSATKVQGSAANFSAIDWARTPLFIGTKIANPTDYKNLGSAKLWSVPYSMVADSTKALLKGSRLSVISSDDAATDALFEVKRKDGQTVFAVYPNAVNVYVPRTTPKGVKGGFAIGGFDGSKIDPQDYFRVTPDSVRIYIDKTPNLLKGATKGGFAIGGFDQVKNTALQDLLTVSNDSVRIYLDANPAPGKGATKGGFAIGGFDPVKGGPTINFLNVATEATGIINPSQNRVLWYPIKNAFLAGKVLVEKPDSVGVNSFATGYESKAKGQYSQALGFHAIARGDYSTAIGKNAVAHKSSSFAFGDAAKALNQDAYSFGAFTEAQGIGSFAFGYVGRDSLGPTGTITRAVGNYSFAMGLGAQTDANADGAFAIGSGTNALGKFSLAMGYKSIATDYYSVAIGGQAQASGSSVAIGGLSVASGTYSVALFGKATGTRAINFGTNSMATGAYSIAMGGYYTSIPAVTINRTEAQGLRSIAIGSGVGALGERSVSIGTGTYGALVTPPAITYGKAVADYSYAIGTSNISDGTNAFAIGNNSTSTGSYSFAIGTDVTTTGSYSFGLGKTVTSSANYSYAIGTNVTASGVYATTIGRYTTAQAYNSFVIGRYNTIEGTTSSWVDDEPLFVIGNGTSAGAPANAFMVRKDGLTEVSGSIKSTGFTPSTGSGPCVEMFYFGGGALRAYDWSSSTYLPLSVYSGIVRPIADNTYSCGHASYRWTAVYAANGAIQTSDRRMKDDIQPLAVGLETVNKLNPITFLWKNQSEGSRHLGLIAQDVMPLVPEVIDIGDDPDKTLGINYAGLVPVLINAIQEQQQQIESSKQENQKLRSELNELKDLVNSLIASQAGQGNK